MNIELTIRIPHCNPVELCIRDCELSALLNLLIELFDSYHSNLKNRINILESELASDSDFLSRLGRKLTVNQVQDFRRILEKRQLSVREICKKYRKDRLEDLTGSDALDVVTGILLAEQKHESKTKTKSNH